MCMVDDNEKIQVLSHTKPRARKAHKCGECNRTIEPGETYERTAGVADGYFETYITCEQCVAVREWLAKVCSGWVYTMVGEDLQEHFREGYGIWLGRAAIGVRRKWRKRNGSLMRPMALPAVLPTPPNWY